jgi:hypothetical protein
MTSWKENVILVDANHLDNVCLQLIVLFERNINRQLQKADLCHWIDCIALDGGMRHGENSTQVIFIHSKDKKEFTNFTPGNFAEQLNAIAFKDSISEFEMSSYPVEDIVSKADFFEQSLETILSTENVKRVMVIADLDEYGPNIKKAALKAEDKEVTLFSMTPTEERGYRQEILGYSIISALGITSEELRG